MCVCVRVRVRACARALRIVSRDKTFRFKNTLIIICQIVLSWLLYFLVQGCHFLSLFSFSHYFWFLSKIQFRRLEQQLMKEFPNGEVEIVSASLVSSVQYVCVCRLHVDEELQPVFLEQSLSVKTQPTTLSISGGSGGGRACFFTATDFDHIDEYYPVSLWLRCTRMD